MRISSSPFIGPVQAFPPVSRQQPRLADAFTPRFAGLWQVATPSIYGDAHPYIKNETSLWRHHSQYQALLKLLQAHFPQGATIYNYACSDGSEPFSIAMALEAAGLPPEKYPIMARDISPSALALAQSGYVVGAKTLDSIEKQVPNLTPKAYFKPVDESQRPQVAQGILDKFPEDLNNRLEQADCDLLLQQLIHPPGIPPTTLYQVSPRLTQRVQFELGDLGTDKLAPEKKPFVILFNCAFHHIIPENQKKILKNVFDQADPGTVLFVSDGINVNHQKNEMHLGGPTFQDMAKSIGFEVAENTKDWPRPLTLTKPKQPGLAIAT